VALADLRARVLVSPHDAVLFPGTIAENIALLAPDGKAAERGTWAAFADQVIDTVPGGAQAPVGDRGESLSGGQRQRVALARALAADPPVLVLHDPTTAVDAATEDRIAGRLRELRAREGRTSLLVTTSPALLSRCDRVFFLRPAPNGAPPAAPAGEGAPDAPHKAPGSRLAADSGTHAELMRDNAAYRELLTR
jgi:putative ABC transport system ATP-binding protein